MEGIRCRIKKIDMDEINKILNIEDKRNQRKLTFSDLITEMISTYKKANDYPEDLSEKTINNFLKTRESFIANRKKL